MNKTLTSPGLIKLNTITAKHSHMALDLNANAHVEIFKDNGKQDEAVCEWGTLPPIHMENVPPPFLCVISLWKAAGKMLDSTF